MNGEVRTRCRPGFFASCADRVKPVSKRVGRPFQGRRSARLKPRPTVLNRLDAEVTVSGTSGGIMKRFGIGLIVAGLMAGAACGRESSAPRKLRLAIIPKALDIPVFNYAKVGAERTADGPGDVDGIWRGPERADELRQKESLESFITQRVDGIAISVLNADFLTSTIDRAVEAGIPVVTWDSDAPRSKRLAFYGVDDYKSGQIMGEEAARLLDGNGTIAIITSLGASNLRRRLDGVQNALANHPGLKIVETYDIKEDPVRCAEIIATGTNRYPGLGAWISVGGWPVFTRNALAAVD